MDAPSLRNQITDILEKAGIQYTIKPHSMPVFTSEDAARERKVALNQIVKTMILHNRAGRVVVALLPGDRRLHIKRIDRMMGGGFQLMAPEKIETITGFLVGAISPVGLMSRGWEMVADPGILENDLVDISSGDASAGIEVQAVDLIRLLNCRIENITR